MTPLRDGTIATQNCDEAEQIRQLQHVVDETRRMLNNVSREKTTAEEDLTKCTEEISQRVNLFRDYGNVMDSLQKLGQLMKTEQCLREQLIVQAEEYRSKRKNLQDRYESVTFKTQSLNNEIEDVTRQLEEARAHNINAQSSKPDPSSKNQHRDKPKKKRAK